MCVPPFNSACLSSGRGVALLNSAGPFQDAATPAPDPNAPKPWYSSIKDAVVDVGKRVVLFFAFQRAKQPERIKEVLEMVYSSTESIDDNLVDSIVVPATDPAAAEVRVSTQSVCLLHGTVPFLPYNHTHSLPAAVSPGVLPHQQQQAAVADCERAAEADAQLAAATAAAVGGPGPLDHASTGELAVGLPRSWVQLDGWVAAMASGQIRWCCYACGLTHSTLAL
jgi:hypothetical protein